MSHIRKSVLLAFEKFPKAVIRKVIARKAEEAGIAFPDAALDALVEHILQRKDGEFVWEDGRIGAENDPPRVFDLRLTEADVAEVEAKIEKGLAELPEVARRTTDKIGRNIFTRLRRSWASEGILQRQEIEEFRARLEGHWGDGFNYLRILLGGCREIGVETYKRHHKSKSKRHHYRRWVLVRLHARACQVADEILCLMENGFADGAMARWRTLHELAVVTILIGEGDEDLAERYILHDAIEVKRQADEFDTTQISLGAAPIGKRQRAAIERQYRAVVERYGASFAFPYGWAAQHLGHKKPTFKELQIAADHAAMNSFYKLASFNVHASARSLFFNLSAMGESELVLAGRSNAGFVRHLVAKTTRSDPGSLVASGSF